MVVDWEVRIMEGRRMGTGGGRSDEEKLWWEI